METVPTNDGSRSCVLTMCVEAKSARPDARICAHELLVALLHRAIMRVRISFLQSKNITSAIYSSNWTMTTPRERKSLIFIMINSQKGIMFSYHGLFALSLQTFTWVSAYAWKRAHFCSIFLDNYGN